MPTVIRLLTDVIFDGNSTSNTSVICGGGACSTTAAIRH